MLTRDIATPTGSATGGRRLLAAAVLGAPVLISINSAFHPPVEMTAASLVEATAASPGQWYAVHLLAALGALLSMAAAVGVRTLVVGRGRRLATAALGFTLVGSTLLALAFAIEASVLHLADAHLDQSAALALAEGYIVSPESYAIPAGVVGYTLGGLLMGVALVVSRAVPRWQSVTLCLATIATAAGAPGTPVAPIAFGTVSLVSVFLALEVARRRAPA